MAGSVGNTQQRQVPMNFGMAANPLIGGAKGGAGGIQRRMDPHGYNAQSFQMSGLPNNYMSMAVGPQVTAPALPGQPTSNQLTGTPLQMAMQAMPGRKIYSEN